MNIVNWTSHNGYVSSKCLMYCLKVDCFCFFFNFMAFSIFCHIFVHPFSSTNRAHQQSICRSPGISSQTFSQLPASGQGLSRFQEMSLQQTIHVSEASKPIECVNNIQPYSTYISLNVLMSNIITRHIKISQFYTSWHSNFWVGFTQCVDGFCGHGDVSIHETFRTGKYFRLTFDSCNIVLNALPQSTALQQNFEKLELITDSSLHAGMMYNMLKWLLMAGWI